MGPIGRDEKVDATKKWPDVVTIRPRLSRRFEMFEKPIPDKVIRTEGRIDVVREYNKHGERTGAYYHCKICGGECMTGWPKANAHRDDCPVAGEDR
jgi:hypothetical protein